LGNCDATGGVVVAGYGKAPPSLTGLSCSLEKLIVLFRGGFLEHFANAPGNSIAQFVKTRRISKKNDAGYRQYNKHTHYL
jgi:hypothetical protein